MANLLTREQWTALTRLYAADTDGIPFDGQGYGGAGRWEVLLQLKDTDPPLMREVFRLNDQRGQHFVVITEAGKRFYEDNEELHDAFYPPA